VTDGLPTQGSPFGRAFQVVGDSIVNRAERPVAGLRVVSASYFETMGLRLRRGRRLADGDREGTTAVVVLNESFVRAYFANRDPIGRQLLVGRTLNSGAEEDMRWTVVGVVADEGLSWDQTLEPMIYATREQMPTDYLALAVRTTIEPHHVQESIRHAVSLVDRDQALADVQLLDDLKYQATVPERLRTTMLLAFATVALGLAAVGLYGVLAYQVVERTREIGIRAALGATRSRLMAVVVREAIVMTTGGLSLGLTGMFFTSRLLTTFSLGVSPVDLRTIALVTAVLLLVAFLACYVPARRVTAVDPMLALRCD
jgi:putative ABC transport system permease protein